MNLDEEEEAMRRIRKGRDRGLGVGLIGCCVQVCDERCRAEAIRDEQFRRRSVSAPGLKVL